MIRKKQMKKGTQLASEPVLESNKDPFEEIHRYLKQPRLRREECPNPIPWWGVCNFNYLTLIQIVLTLVLDEL
jgi:hypothetical protein